MSEMNDKKKTSWIVGLILGILAIALVVFVEVVLRPGYLGKSIAKVLSFCSVILLYSAISKQKPLDTINLHKAKGIGKLIGFILLFFAGIMILCFLLRNYIDLSHIRESLFEKEKLTKENCLFAFAYIIIVNSFLEEAFFRGFLNGIFPGKWVGAVISALLFSAYHISIIGTWFHPAVLALSIGGLVLVGLFLQWLDSRYKSIIAGWLVHAGANIAINVIGALMIFGVI